MLGLALAAHPLSWPMVFDDLFTLLIAVEGKYLERALRSTGATVKVSWRVGWRPQLRLTAAGRNLAAIVGRSSGAEWLPARRAARVDPMVALRSE